MPAEQPIRITLRPPPHRDYLQGYPGIPPYSPDNNDDTHAALDPLLPLPRLERKLAHLTGTVELRFASPSNSKGLAGVRAKWLSVELEKIEVVPPDSGASSSEEGGVRGGKKGGGGGGAGEDHKFVELIGTGPSKLWEAGQQGSSSAAAGNGLRPVISISTSNLHSPAKKRTGFLGGVFSSSRASSSSRALAAASEEANEGPDEEGYDLIPEGSYPFSIPLPEGLPPTVELATMGGGTGGGGERGISYQIVASLAVKPKKSLLKSSAATGKPTLHVSSASIYLDKADILPSWPAYSPLLPLPLPAHLPWASVDPSKPTVGETREARAHLESKKGGEVWIKATRMGAAFGPGDEVRLWVQVGWGGEEPIKLTRLDLVLRESPTYRYPSPSNPSYITRAPPKLTTVLSANASVSPEPERDRFGFAVLYQHEPLAFEVKGSVPIEWKRMTVRTAKHIDIGYHLKIRAMLEGGDEISIDHWPVIVANIPTRSANGIVREIGWVQGLCDRPGMAVLAPEVVAAPVVEVESRMNGSPAPRPATAATARFHIANPSASTDSSPPPSPPPQNHLYNHEPSPMAGFVPSTRAEEEKLRYYEQATRTRDVLQSSLRASTNGSNSDRQHVSSPISPSSMHAYEEAAQVQLATLVPAAGADRSHSALERSMTTVAWSGSDAGAPSAATASAAMASSLSASAATASQQLGRSLTLAEQEKARLYDDAKKTARQRQDEAARQQEQAHSGRSQAEIDFEQAQDAFERRLILEAEEDRRREEERIKAEFEASERARIEAEEERWRVEEEQRRARALAELEDKKRRAEQALADELRRFEEQRRLQANERSAELERQADERRREDEMKRQRAQEMRRLDEERERAIELERQRRAAAAALAEEEDRRRRAAAVAQEEALRRQQREEEEALLRQREEEEARQRAQEQARRQALFQQQVRQQDLARQQQQEQQARAVGDARQAEMSELEQLRAEQRRLLEEREELRRALAAQQSPERHAYTPSPAPTRPAYNEYSPPPPPPLQESPSIHSPQPLVRAPSVASFAPSMSAANATAEAYAQAIRQQSSTLSDEKAAYLRQLRQRSQGGSSISQHNGPAYPSTATLARQDTYSSASVVSTLPPMSVVSASAPPPVPALPAQTSRYKTAAEEKEEEAARRRAQDAAAAAAARTQDSPVGDAPPPSYPANGASASTAPIRSATEEKAELERYYAAKAAVDMAQRPEPPARSHTQGDMSSSLAPAYPTPLRSGTAPPLDFGTAPSPAYPPSSEESSVREDDQRDPSIAAGKRALRAGSSSNFEGASLASAPAPSNPYMNGYANGHSSLGPENLEFGSFGLGSFPGYESMQEQISEYNQQRGGGGS
ncbi:hypothetical protein JCM10908_002662 [Rhodotorula pacifica]|uniref:uncharacterized protein n=1 Tax=Rhodotorula pacifica TaxID=1495444 RepID=UPI003181F07A